MIQEFKRIFTKKRKEKRQYPLFHWKITIKHRDGVLSKSRQYPTCLSGVCGVLEVIPKEPSRYTWTHGQGPFSCTGVLQRSALQFCWLAHDYRHTFAKQAVRKNVFLCVLFTAQCFKNRGQIGNLTE